MRHQNTLERRLPASCPPCCTPCHAITSLWSFPGGLVWACLQGDTRLPLPHEHPGLPSRARHGTAQARDIWKHKHRKKKKKKSAAPYCLWKGFVGHHSRLWHPARTTPWPAVSTTVGDTSFNINKRCRRNMWIINYCLASAAHEGKQNIEMKTNVAGLISQRLHFFFFYKRGTSKRTNHKETTTKSPLCTAPEKKIEWKAQKRVIFRWRNICRYEFLVGHFVFSNPDEFYSILLVIFVRHEFSWTCQGHQLPDK